MKHGICTIGETGAGFATIRHVPELAGQALKRWAKRELERQLDGGLFERTLIAKPKLSPALREIHPSAESAFKDGYSPPLFPFAINTVNR